MANRSINLRKKPRVRVPDDASNLEKVLSSIPDGREVCVSYLRQFALTDNTYVELIREFDDDRSVDLGVLCVKHKIEPSQLLADVNKAAYPVIDEALNLSKAIATGMIAKHLPAVADRAGKEAKKPDGVFDRHQILMQTGHHLAPKAAAININQNNMNAAGLPTFEDDTKGLSDILNADDHLLTEGETDYIEAEIEEEVETVPIGRKKDEEAA